MGKAKNKKANSQLSRRDFIGKSSILFAGAALGMSNTGMNLFSSLPPEPIIDIHQHADYYGRTNNFLVPHQRAMGVTKTILLPAGRPVITSATHNGFSNGLQAAISGNETAYDFAKNNSTEFLFGACEVPDLPDAIETIEKYLKLGAVVIGELKFAIPCDSLHMQRIYQLAQSMMYPFLCTGNLIYIITGLIVFIRCWRSIPKLILSGMLRHGGQVRTKH